MKKVWQLPVKQSNVTDHDWVHPKARFHFFVDDNSLCGKYTQDTDFFETSPEDCGVELNSDNTCKECLKLFEETKDAD